MRDVLVVASGTAAAQIVTMGFAPIITRIYGPETYGLLGIFGSVVGLLATVAAFGYPIAIVLPAERSDAIGIAKLSIYIGMAMAIVGAMFVAVFGGGLLEILNAGAIIPYLYLIPLAMLVSVSSAVLEQWLIRERAFGLIARYRVLVAFLLSVTKSGIGSFYPTALVLITVNTAGGLLGIVLTFWGWLRFSENRVEQIKGLSSRKSLKRLAYHYRDFPMLRTPQNLINLLSQVLPLWLISANYGAAAAGQYSIALTVLGVPAALIGGSVVSVFYPRVTEAIHNRENARALIIKATFAMAVTGALPFFIVVILGPSLFSFAFGEAWRTAGEYAQWLSLWLFLQYVNKPAVSAIPALGLQRGLLVYELFSTGSKILALWVGFVLLGDDVPAVALFAITGAIAYLWLILWVIARSGGSAPNKVR